MRNKQCFPSVRRMILAQCLREHVRAVARDHLPHRAALLGGAVDAYAGAVVRDAVVPEDH